MAKPTPRRIYLDHAAATPVDPRVQRVMLPFFSKQFGNPGGIHREGRIAQDALRRARESVARSFSALPEEIVFTSSATASANVAILGVLKKWKSIHSNRVPTVITSPIEHAAVREPLALLSKEGVSVLHLPLLPTGIVDVSGLEKMITADTALVSVMYANNEIGTLQPIREIAKVLRAKRREFGATTKEEVFPPLFHTDACQAINSEDISVLRLGVDLLTANCAKSYGPKGVGVLFVRKGVSLDPPLVGGGQERGLWPGTENVPLAVGCAKAIELAQKEGQREHKRQLKLRDALMKGILAHIPDAHINGDPTCRLSGNVSVTIPGADHENVVIMLDSLGIACSTKSACNEEEAEVSHVIEALRKAGDATKYPASAIRMTLGKENTMSDVNAVIRAFKHIRPRLRPLI